MAEFSFRTREAALKRFRAEQFDFLIIGGGITGAAAARDAVSRGLKVALVERSDFASGTSSASSKLIHGGLRYLENFELALVFEALAERALLLRTVPHLVRPLPFYFPVYKGDAHGRFILSCGLWLYDLLALFRSPKFHRSLSKRAFLAAIPFLKADGLKGGLRYYDASMWDDVMVVHILRATVGEGAAVANYVEAVAPIMDSGRVAGFALKDLISGEKLEVRAHRTIVCGGPWTDEIGARVAKDWTPWLKPSKGIHLVFDHKRIPLPGALVMSHPEDGRISFVIPRKDLGAGVVIVGTTDSPTPDPTKPTVEAEDVRYLLRLLDRYFPSLQLKASDILSSYVGTRPLMASQEERNKRVAESDHSGASTSRALQKISREHYIGDGPGNTIFVAGGKYTTHRRMATEIVDIALKRWKDSSGKGPAPPKGLKSSDTAAPIFPEALPEAAAAARAAGAAEALVTRYGSAAREVEAMARPEDTAGDPAGFPSLEAQLRYCIRNEAVVRLGDFYFRRLPIFLARADHGEPWIERLARVWAEERGLSPDAAAAEGAKLLAEIELRASATQFEG
jgi:glycerol-3-phosphate dehydrogenase